MQIRYEYEMVSITLAQFSYFHVNLAEIINSVLFSIAYNSLTQERWIRSYSSVSLEVYFLTKWSPCTNT